MQIRNNKSIKGIKVKNVELRISQYSDDSSRILEGAERSLKQTILELSFNALLLLFQSLVLRVHHLPLLFFDHLCYLCLECVMLSRLFIAVLCSPAGKEVTSWLFFVMFCCDFVTFPFGILGQVWYFIVLIPDLCHLSY